jgi:hypothetical protein
MENRAGTDNRQLTTTVIHRLRRFPQIASEEGTQRLGSSRFPTAGARWTESQIAPQLRAWHEP